MRSIFYEKLQLLHNNEEVRGSQQLQDRRMHRRMFAASKRKF